MRERQEEAELHRASCRRVLRQLLDVLIRCVVPAVKNGLQYGE